ncbi:hypothetical protein [Hymenobacter sp. UYCo722]|uniref:hypothetical protein n=1 Tax=Hymenobacter sp. UYCo722 TaxID=3156335 RepID=UPI003392A88C
MVVINSVVLLEALLTPFLEARYKGQGLSKTAITKKFKTGYRTMPEGIAELCKSLAREDANGAIEEGAAYNQMIQTATESIESLFRAGEKHYPMGISEICEKLVPEVTGQAFKGTDVYKNLATNAIAIRNQLVHGERIDVSEEEAQLCAWSVIKAVGVINALALIKEAREAMPHGELIMPLPAHPYPYITKAEEAGKLTYQRKLWS